MNTITVDRAVLEQALEDLKEFGNHYEYCHRYITWAQPEFRPPCNCGYDNSFTALRAALAQENQKPVPYTLYGKTASVGDLSKDFTELFGFYSPPPRRDWHGLTEEEINCWTPEIHWVIRAIEAKLKERNS